MFWREQLFDDALVQLRALGYKVVTLDAAHDGVDELLVGIGEALDLPDYYGHNLDALNDCLRDVAAFAYGADSDSTGTVVAFRHFDRVAERAPDRAEAVLDIFTSRARDGLLFGHRMMVLVQSDDPEASFGPLGAQHALWNEQERLSAARRMP